MSLELNMGEQAPQADALSIILVWEDRFHLYGFLVLQILLSKAWVTSMVKLAVASIVAG